MMSEIKIQTILIRVRRSSRFSLPVRLGRRVVLPNGRVEDFTYWTTRRGVLQMITL